MEFFETLLGESMLPRRRPIMIKGATAVDSFKIINYPGTKDILDTKHLESALYPEARLTLFLNSSGFKD